MRPTLNPGRSHHAVETFGKWWDFSFYAIAEVVVLRYRKRHGWQPTVVAYALFRGGADTGARVMVDDHPNASVAFQEAVKKLSVYP